MISWVFCHQYWILLYGISFSLHLSNNQFFHFKVDRSVTGLVAQQQCVGPLHTPLADVAVTALSHFDTHGSATAIGEQPIKGLVNNESGARMTVGEALTNLVFAKISDLKVRKNKSFSPTVDFQAEKKIN